jgi:hypothetical protein
VIVPHTRSTPRTHQTEDDHRTALNATLVAGSRRCFNLPRTRENEPTVRAQSGSADENQRHRRRVGAALLPMWIDIWSDQAGGTPSLTGIRRPDDIGEPPVSNVRCRAPRSLPTLTATPIRATAVATYEASDALETGQPDLHYAGGALCTPAPRLWIRRIPGLRAASSGSVRRRLCARSTAFPATAPAAAVTSCAVVMP